MSLQFSEHGPAFPYALVDAMLGGDVVFLCGAGVSAPHLPMFAELVEQVYPRIGLEPAPSETEALKVSRYEEVLGTLSRRLANPSRLYEAVTEILSKPDVDTAHHRTLLRLSRARDNRVILVTTNFDGLFERALDEIEGTGSGKRASLAGQALPPPGTQACHGIIHLHGRIADPSSALEATPLVLTSAEYGDAYMRSGWASRFLFDLVRCKTLVLIGYSASDAPVRYFLNLLEGDRERFADLRTVYALDAYNDAPSETSAKWETIAVTPIGFRAGNGGDRFEPLWRDLEHLVELVEQPANTRRARCKALLQKTFAHCSEEERDEVEWLLRGRGDLWWLATTCISDPDWLAHFEAARLWPGTDGQQIVANWCCQQPTERVHLETAINWHRRFGQTFAQLLEQRLLLTFEKIPRPWAQAWRTLIRSRPAVNDVLMHHYRLSQALNSPLLDDGDLRRAVHAITPRIELRARAWFDDRQDVSAEPITVRDIVSVSLSLESGGIDRQLSTAIREVEGRDRRLAQLCSEALTNVGLAAEEIGLITPDWDALNHSVPSVDDHEQNAFNEGAVDLCVVLTEILSRLATVGDRDSVRTLARSLQEVPGVLGQRLWLSALRNAQLFTADEAAQAILGLPRVEFWSIRRELVLTMQSRLSMTAENLVERIVARVLHEAPLLYAEFEVEDGIDWRAQAQDHRVWLLLTAISKAGVLPVQGQRALAAVRERRDFLGDDFEESDLFESYSSGVYSVQGDPALLAEADEEQRLDVARTQRNAPDFAGRLSWAAYCSQQPTAAFEALRNAGFEQDNAGLWLDFLQAIVNATAISSERIDVADGLVLPVFERLEAATDSWLAEQLSPLSYLLRRYAAHVHDNNKAGEWWDRLWRLAESHELPISEEDTDRFYDRVINRPSGRLVEWLLVNMDSRFAEIGFTDDDRNRLRRVIASETAAGWLGRGVCARNGGFLLRVDLALASGPLRRRLHVDNLEGRSLRAVMLSGAQLLDDLSMRVYKRALFRAICETSKADSGGTLFASQALYPLLYWRTRPRTGRPPLTSLDVRRLLTRVPPPVLAGAAKALSVWIKRFPADAGHTWRTFVGPVFALVWPNEARFKRAAIARELAELCVAAGPAFEQAFADIHHFLVPLEGDACSVSFLHGSEAVTSAPVTSLEMVWLLCGPGASDRAHGLPDALHQISEAAPALTVDRRFQWLEQNRVVRYE